jgi:tRNA(fMet)-specific endonuclease VapC
VEQAVLLDTDVYSFVSGGHSRGEAFRRVLEGKRLCLSFATIAELYKGARKRGWSDTRIEDMEVDLHRYLVIEYDALLARTCGELLAERESAGWRMEEFDAWIAATALRHAIPLATNNRRHFSGIPRLELIQPAGQ